LGTACTSRSTSVVLPVPEAADTMNSNPRRSADPDANPDADPDANPDGADPGDG
jgi:hypothetical protein